jgi:capsular polysaccharide biosynthesis protein
MQGFTSVTLEGWTVADQAELFSGADIIVGVHGAALTNLIFSRSGTSVLEILPSSLQEPGMFTAATHSNLNYWFVLGDRLDSEGNFSIAVPKLQRALDAMISKPP